MPPFDQLVHGYAMAVEPANLLLLFLGVALGTLIGFLPGLGAPTGVALLLPLSSGLDPLPALIMLAGIYYGSQYGGSIASILAATPGESSAVMTAIEGYKLARQGRAGPALAISALASFLGGMLTLPLLIVFLPVLGDAALAFGPPEYFSLMLFGIIGIAGLSGEGNRIKGVAMGTLGITLSTVGLDPVSATARFTFGSTDLLSGLGFIPALIGLFALGENLATIDSKEMAPIHARFRDMLPTIDDLCRSFWPSIRCALMGFVIGVLPGAGATLASFVGYDVERRLSRRREQWGSGVIEGVAAPEAANNAAVNGSFIPTLALGLPGSATTGVLLAALILHGIRPGPNLLVEQGPLVWGLIASFSVGNLALLILNLPLAPVWGSLLRIRYSFIFASVLLFSMLGAFADENSVFGMWIAIGFGVLAYLLRRFSYPLVPLVLGLLLGPMLEEALTQTSAMAFGDMSILITRPISALLLFVTVVVLAGAPIRIVVRRHCNSRKPQAIQSETR